MYIQRVLRHAVTLGFHLRSQILQCSKSTDIRKRKLRKAHALDRVSGPRRHITGSFQRIALLLGSLYPLPHLSGVSEGLVMDHLSALQCLRRP